MDQVLLKYLDHHIERTRARPAETAALATSEGVDRFTRYATAALSVDEAVDQLRLAALQQAYQQFFQQALQGSPAPMGDLRPVNPNYPGAAMLQGGPNACGQKIQRAWTPGVGPSPIGMGGVFPAVASEQSTEEAAAANKVSKTKTAITRGLVADAFDDAGYIHKSTTDNTPPSERKTKINSTHVYHPVSNLSQIPDDQIKRLPDSDSFKRMAEGAGFAFSHRQRSRGHNFDSYKKVDDEGEHWMSAVLTSKAQGGGKHRVWTASYSRTSDRK